MGPTVSGHPGQNKTVDLIRRDYTWPRLCEFVKKYCKSCTTCMRTKPQRHKPYGLLKQLPIPKRPWNSISMDFIETLPTSSGSNSILVIVNWLTKQGIFILMTVHCTSKDLAVLFITHMFSIWSTWACHLWLRFWIHIQILPVPQKSTRHEAPLHLQIPPRRWRTNGMD